MIEKLDYAMVPTGFVHCFNGNCKNANRCLRHQIIRFIPDTLWAVSVVNPARTSPTGKCAAFMADTPVQYAVGMDPIRPDTLSGGETHQATSVDDIR